MVSIDGSSPPPLIPSTSKDTSNKSVAEDSESEHTETWYLRLSSRWWLVANHRQDLMTQVYGH